MIDFPQFDNEAELFQILMENLLENSTDSIYFKDLKSRFIRASDFLARRVGVDSPAELIGKTDFDCFDVAHARDAREDEQKIIDSGEPLPIKIEKEVIPSDKTRWAMTSKWPLKDRHGNTIGTFGISRDVTPQKEAEIELEKTHQLLVRASRQAGMSEIASNMLHNIGNVLNSINTSIATVVRIANELNIERIANAGDLLQELIQHCETAAKNEKMVKVPAYLIALSQQFESKQEVMLAELESLAHNVYHVEQILKTQQSYAANVSVLQKAYIADLLADAVRMCVDSFERHNIELDKQIIDDPEIQTEKHKVLQILVNLLMNAKDACVDAGTVEGRITIKTFKENSDTICVSVRDNGIGITPEHMEKIFSHGFTTKTEGSGFGLHSSANMAAELGGTLKVASEGSGQGSIFTLKIPLVAKESDAAG